MLIHLLRHKPMQEESMTLTLSGLIKAQLDQAYRACQIILDKGEAHAREAGVDEAVYLNWRLSADMYPFAKQIQLVSDFSARGLARLAGTDPVSTPDTETSFEALKARVERTREIVWGFDEAAIDADPTAPVTFPAGRDRELTLPRQAYAQNFVIANTLFHTAMAYGILRQIGVPLGKADAMGMVQR
jgi:hypothetical protein